MSSLSASNSFSYQPYTFNDYFIGGTNYSGNKLTGVPKTINVSTIEVVIKNHFYTNIIFNNTSSIPLTDANDVYANDYRLLQLKMGYRFIKTKTSFHLFAGIDNALNQLYSLGNDINALGKRYHNPAAARNFFAGIKIGW